MSVRLKPLKEQVIVITGASSGIGLATAQLAAHRGAKLVLCSRNKNELDRICAELNRNGKKAIAVECDVAEPDAVQRVADRAVEEFGGFDTWVNNAGVSIYGKLTEVPLEEKRRLFDVNFWGIVHGCRSAVRHLRSRGGAIINLGSVVSDRSIPIQGIYSASKHAIKAYTDALRMELETEGLPISVTLVKPASIDTPFTEHAVNHMEHHPRLPPPVYKPEVVAHAILEAAASPKRDVYVGGLSRFESIMDAVLPRIADLLMEKAFSESAQSSPQKDHIPQEPSLFEAPEHEGRVRGHHSGRVMNRSLYTSASFHPGTAALIATGLGLATAAGIRYYQSQSRRDISVSGEWSRSRQTTH